MQKNKINSTQHGHFKILVLTQMVWVIGCAKLGSDGDFRLLRQAIMWSPPELFLLPGQGQ